MGRSAIRLLLVGDLPAERAGLSRLISARCGMKVVAEAESGLAALELYPESRPALVLMELHMREIGGLETSRRLLKDSPEARILLYCGLCSPILLARALELGVQGIISKESVAERLFPAISGIVAGNAFLCPELLSHLEDYRRSGDEPLLNRLSNRELELFRLAAIGQGNDQLAKLLQLTPASARALQQKVRRKLEVNSDVEMMRLAVRLGLISP